MDAGTKKVGILTADDLKTAESNYAEKVKQAIDNSIKPVAPFNQKVVFVPAHNVSADRKAGEEVSEFVLSGTNTVVVVYFNSDDLKSVLGKEISGRIDAGTEKVLSVSKEPQVSLGSYDLVKQQARLSIYQDVLVTLDANADKLAAGNFGKIKMKVRGMFWSGAVWWG